MEPFNLSDWNTMRKALTPAKLLNLVRLYAGYQYSRLTKKPHQWGLPAAVSIEPTTACNLGCPECPSGLKQFSRPTGNLKPETFKQVLDELGSHLTYLTFYFQGEPLIHPELLQMVKMAATRGIYTATSTNAHFISDHTARQIVESKLSRLIISIDGTTQEVYEAYRKKGRLDKVLEGTKRVLEWKKRLKSATPHIIFQFLVVRPNEHQIPEVYELAKQLGVNEVRLKTAQVNNYKNGNPLIPENETYSRYRKQADGTYRLKNSLVNQCWKMWQSCVITWDGRVVPCCFDKDAKHQLGSLQKKSFRAIWFGAAYRRFRQAILTSRSNIDICKNCSEGTKVWA